ncbi:MAG: hypothetical protein JXR42_03040 [Gammaproteobacteria bacterium]|nr:hypothetical protein [Gammaproteobacteria bacterium]
MNKALKSKLQSLSPPRDLTFRHTFAEIPEDFIPAQEQEDLKRACTEIGETHTDIMQAKSRYSELPEYQKTLLAPQIDALASYKNTTSMFPMALTLLMDGLATENEDVQIPDFLSPENLQPRLSSTEQEAILASLARQLIDANFIHQVEQIIAQQTNMPGGNTTLATQLTELLEQYKNMDHAEKNYREIHKYTEFLRVQENPYDYTKTVSMLKSIIQAIRTLLGAKDGNSYTFQKTQQKVAKTIAEAHEAEAERANAVENR